MTQVEPVETSWATAGGFKPRKYGSWYVAEHRLRGMRSYLPSGTPSFSR